MELHCELSRASLGFRKNLGAEGMEASSTKLMYSKRNHANGDAIISKNHDFSEERNTNGEEPMEGTHGEAFPSNEASKVKNSLHPRPKSCTKKLKENGAEPKVRVGRRKSAPDATDIRGQMRRRKQQNSQDNHASNLKHQEEVASENRKERRSDRPITKRRQKQAPKAVSERGKDQCSRAVKRQSESEVLLPQNLPNGKGMKRSRRVAQRLAQVEPPPPPLKLPRLHIVLTRKEIQEDWIKITGHKYTGKARKSTLIQKGLGLCTALTCPSSIEYLNEPH